MVRVVRAAIRRIGMFIRGPFSSAGYWEARYRQGGNSGTGSYGKFGAYKAEFINQFVRHHDVNSVIELGCGDSAQAELFEISEYTGVDVSPRAIELCRHAFRDRPRWRFFEAKDRIAYAGTYDLVLSLDVVYHLIEDAIYDAYMSDLFDHACSHVLIYSSDDAAAHPAEHVKHRKHSDWVAANRTDWRRVAMHANPHTGKWPEGSFAFFTHYTRNDR